MQNIIWRRIDPVKETLFMRQPSWEGSDEVDIENNGNLSEYPLGIVMVTSFQMDLQC